MRYLFSMMALILMYGCGGECAHQLKIQELENEIEVLNSSNETSDNKKLVHTVFFDLKDDLDHASKTKMIEGIKQLANIPQVQYLTVGGLAPTGDKRMMDQFELALTTEFKTLADLKIYDQDEDHQKLRATLGAFLAGPPKVFDYWTE